MLRRLRTFCAPETVRIRLTVAILSAIGLVYVGIGVLGHTLPDATAATPLFLRLHPERILAMAAAVLGMLRLIDHVHQEKYLMKPLLWILFASLVHLASIAVQLGWLSAGQG